MTPPDTTDAAKTAASSARQLRLYRAVARVVPLGYRNKIMLIAFVGTHVPLLTLVIFFALRTENFRAALPVIGIALVATLLGTGLTLIILNGLLQPILMTRSAVHAYVAHGHLPSLPTDCTDEAGQLMADTVASLLRLNAVLETLAYVDRVTGLPNRDDLLKRLDVELARRQPIALCILSLQNLDEIMAAFGEVGAVVALRTIGARLQTIAQKHALIARVDGRRFAISATLTPEAPNLTEQAETILALLGRDIQENGLLITPQVTAGIALAPEDAQDSVSLLDAAQAAVPTAHADSVAFYAPETQSSARLQMNVQRALRRAIEQDALSLHYQPVVRFTAGSVTPTIIGAEALLRWTDPDLGAMAPSVFIPIAERSGLIDEIGPWVLKTGCSQMQEWEAIVPPNFRLAINLSARQFSDQRLVQLIADSISGHRLSRDRLEVEMTETAAMQDRATTRRVFGALRELGVTVAIDDFGTGYSTMSQLRDMPFDTLKIDREFVRDVDGSASGRAICKALIELGRGLDIAVLAEGVERSEEVATLQSYGCAIFQGFHFGRPMPAPAFAEALRQQATLTA
jgi:diguanylate cyclase (GGDEF)-like protein